KVRDREKGTSETVEELRYGTEYDPPNLPQNVPENVEVVKKWPDVGVTTTAFETRNVGAKLQVEPVVSADGTLLVTCSAEHVRFLRWEKVDWRKLADGKRLFVEQPVFHPMKDSGTFALNNGKRVVIGSHKVQD